MPDTSGGADFVQGRARGVSGPEEEVEPAEPSRWETTVPRERVRFRKLISPETTYIVFLQTSPRGKLSFITIAVTDEEDERYPALLVTILRGDIDRQVLLTKSVDSDRVDVILTTALGPDYEELLPTLVKFSQREEDTTLFFFFFFFYFGGGVF